MIWISSSQYYTSLERTIHLQSTSYSVFLNSETLVFKKQLGKNTSTERWYKHFKTGAYAAAVLWGAPMWLFYPYNYPVYWSSPTGHFF